MKLSMRQGGRLVRRGMFFAAALWLGMGCATAAGTLDKLRDSRKLVIGYGSDTPIAQADAAGKAGGYANAVCTRVAESLRNDLKLGALSVESVAVPLAERFSALAQGRVDLLCGAVPTLGRRAEVDFSIPMGFAAVNAVVRSDAPVRLVQVLAGKEPPQQPIWRGTNAPERRSIAVVGNTTVERALMDRLAERRISIDVVPVKDTAAGLQAVVDRQADAFLDGRVLLVDALARSQSKSSLVLLDKVFRRELVSIGVRRGDDDFRLAVDRALSRIYRSGELARIYAAQLQRMDQATLDFFELVALPD